MHQKILVTYATLSGSTREVAEAVASELGKDGVITDVQRFEEVENISPYAAVVAGGPMVLGWHRGAVKFLKKHQQSLSKIPLAYFITAMSLTRTRQKDVDGVPIFVDPSMGSCPQKPDRRSSRERYASVDNYLGPVLKQTPLIRPVSVAFFGGKLDYSSLNLPQLLFVRLIIRVPPGDQRNWGAIREWATGLYTLFA